MIKSLLATRPIIRARIGSGSGLAVPENLGSNFGPSRQKFVDFLFDLVADTVDEIFRCDTDVQGRMLYYFLWP
jgi:hypothetical protein